MSYDTELDSRTDVRIKYPNRYNILIHNDNETPQEFVVQLLVEVFDKDLDTARTVMLQVHNDGHGVAGTYNQEMAEQKLYEAKQTISLNELVLKITLEQL